MRYDSDKHHRRSIRLRGYDYSQPGAYFVTICARQRACLFGSIVDDVLNLTDAGAMIAATWQAMTQRFANLSLDRYVVMPNHFHAIVHLHPVGAPLVAALGEIVGAFKSITTHASIQGVRQQGWLPFDRQLWQRTYWDHIIRDERDAERIREYIVNNPLRWTRDALHPAAATNRFNKER